MIFLASQILKGRPNLLRVTTVFSERFVEETLLGSSDSLCDFVFHAIQGVVENKDPYQIPHQMTLNFIDQGQETELINFQVSLSAIMILMELDLLSFLTLINKVMMQDTAHAYLTVLAFTFASLSVQL